LVVLNSSNQIVGYYAYIPTVTWLLDREVPASFCVDLYVPSEQRGQGIQRLTDQVIRQMAGLQLSFPNELSFAIHRKHGLGVRDDYRSMMLPLIPPKVVPLRFVRGGKGLAVRCAAQLARPAAWLYRRWLERYEPVSAQILEEPEAESLAAIFLRQRDGWITTNRSADFIRWRYLESPHRLQYTFFIGGAGSTPSLAAVSRTLTHWGVTVTRILDIFGDLEDRKGVSDIVRLAAREAVKQGASQVRAVASDPTLISTLRVNGFFANRFRFRWSSQDPEVMRIIGESRCHWVLADSDNDLLD
jgi:hypothetical protein